MDVTIAVFWLDRGKRHIWQLYRHKKQLNEQGHRMYSTVQIWFLNQTNHVLKFTSGRTHSWTVAPGTTININLINLLLHLY